MNKGLKALLIVVALACFGIALSYPIRYEMQTRSNQQTMQRLSDLREAGLRSATQASAQPDGTAAPASQGGPVTSDKTSKVETEAVPVEGTAPPIPAEDRAEETAREGAEAAPTDETSPEAGRTDAPDATTAPVGGNAETAVIAAPLDGKAALDGSVTRTPEAPASNGEDAQKATASQGTNASEASVTDGAGAQKATASQGANAQAASASESAGAQTAASVAPPAPTPSPSPSPTPSPTPDRTIRTGALPYTLKEKVELDESRILPQYQELYALNHDMVGWITVQNSDIDYPVVQCEDSDYYLKHDFFGEENKNGQIILDTLCDPYTPSYNLIISGHNMKNESMFSRLYEYFRYKEDWKKHKFIEFDTLMEQRYYVVIAAFFSANYDEDEEGFRYNTDIRYRVDAEQWLDEVRTYQLYDTGLDAGFGDEFLTLTTCNSNRRKNGRFVVICRRIREGETIE